MQKETKAKGKLPVIVTLTSIPSRIKTLSITIKSLLAQDRTPEKIVLWLNEELKGNLPKGLSKLQSDLFEIRFSPYHFSHRKLLHSLLAFPDKILITCDDDMIYHSSALRLTYEQHLKHPDKVIGNRCREISYYQDGSVKPYLQWPFVIRPLKDERLLMPVGAFLVLYPPHVLKDIVTNVELFTKISPKSDDLWFKTCTLLNDRLSISSDRPPPEPIPIFGTQSVALKHINNTEDFKRKQWENIIAHFELKF